MDRDCHRTQTNRKRPARTGSWLACLGLVLANSGPAGQAALLELTGAVVVEPVNASALEQRAVTMLLDEVERRTGVRWVRARDWPQQGAAVIAVGLDSESRLAAMARALDGRARPDPVAPGAEGFRLVSGAMTGAPVALVLGHDLRGVLFGVGRLLRELRMTRNRVELTEGLDLTTTPKTRLRGHQLGYRPKTNSYDAWDLSVWEQYIRDLVVFGCNAIELIPPRSDDAADSPHFPRPPMEMMIGMSRLADAYGLDVWVWYPAMDPDYGDPRTVAAAIAEWGEVLRKLPRLDAVFVPGGDPGHTEPGVLLGLLEKQAENLRRFHASAQMWVSPQGFSQAWMDAFLGILNSQSPAWLDGVVFGPQVRSDLPVLRGRVPARYPIRLYPDITHSRQCQYPVPDWDVAYAVTEGRECINPRPEEEAAIFRATQPGTVGFISYSEGCNDDVNKMVWSGLGWDPEAKVSDILRDYSRYFVGERYADSLAQGLLALERNWRGPLELNAGVDLTLLEFLAMEKEAAPQDRKNWRFQQALFRAFYDAYIRRRLLHESDLEARAMECLRQAPEQGPRMAMSDAETFLDRSLTDRIGPELRQKVGELGEALFQSISMQLSVEKHKAIAVGRGASLDTLDFPLNNRPWLKAQFARIRQLPSSTDQLNAIAELLNWENPGPGGFYDDLGNAARQPHLVRGATFVEDPGRMRSSRVGFAEGPMSEGIGGPEGGVRRVSWMDHAESLYDTPLQVQYSGLDPQAQYRIRVVYGGDAPQRRIRLVAGDDIEVHPLQSRPWPIKPLEYDLPPQATAQGRLTLTWTGEPGLGGNGRGCQVSELWLMKKP